MILDSLQHAAAYEALHPLFPAAFEFLRRVARRGDLPEGRMEIDGDRLFALVMRGAGKPVSEAPLETHRRYIDIQYIVSGVDRMGWKPASECRPGRGYDEVRDLEFHDPSPEVWINVSAGRMAIFFPEDAHAPLAHTGVSLQKIVVKVARSGPEAPAFPCRPTRVSGS